MGQRFNAFLNGIATVFNVIPKATHWTPNYIKPVNVVDFPNLSRNEESIAKNMQKIMTQDFGNALNKVKDDLSADELETFEKLSKLHEKTEKYYADLDTKRNSQ